MSSYESENTGKLWGWAIVAGVLAFLALKFLAAYAFWPALLLAILIGILVAILLWIGFYRDSGDGDMGLGQSSSANLGASSTRSPAPTSAPATKASNLTSAVSSKPATKPAAKKPAAKKPAAKKPAAKSASRSTKATKKRTTSTKKPKQSGKAAASSLMGDAGAAMVSAKKAAQAKAKPTRKPVSKSGKPAMLNKARAGGADDLKQIKGVGLKMEKMLNTMGVYHFDQVAGWRAKEVEWVDENLEGFKGRVSRDSWVKQAKTLAKGGVTEFSKRVKKGSVY
ncbi:MAG: NADH:quinone oxidoreductase [Paracoccaceae bacterium]